MVPAAFRGVYTPSERAHRPTQISPVAAHLIPTPNRRSPGIMITQLLITVTHK